jgi:phosphinothricin acetyltransferase
MIIRLAQIDDLPVIVEIYNQSIPSKSSTADTQPVRVEDRMTWFQEHKPDQHPILIAEIEGQVAGWCSVSAYRPGRQALRFTAEISYYIAPAYQRQGIASALIKHAVESCPALQIKNLFAIVLERNTASHRLLEKMDFEQWGFLPRVADFDGEETGHVYYGKRVWDS